MQQVVDTFMAALPYTPEWAEVGKLPFDTLGGRHDIYIGEQIAAYGFAHYPDRFNVWREDFNACFPVPPDTLGITRGFRNSYWHILWEHPCHNGAQAVWNLQDVSCTTVPHMDQCDPAQCSKDSVLWRAAKRTLQYGMTYLDLYATDVQYLLLHGTMQQVADSLTVNATKCFGSNLSVGNPKQIFSWKVYPNPATTELIVDMENLQSPVAISLRDFTGKLVQDIRVVTNSSGSQ